MISLMVARAFSAETGGSREPVVGYDPRVHMCMFQHISSETLMTPEPDHCDSDQRKRLVCSQNDRSVCTEGGRWHVERHLSIYPIDDPTPTPTQHNKINTQRGRRLLLLLLLLLLGAGGRHNYAAILPMRALHNSPSDSTSRLTVGPVLYFPKFGQV